jgi:outer membrane protein OmpA-like peptidoglycan-associated protein
MKLRTVLLAATVLAVPVAAHAQPIEGLYIGAGVGGNYESNTNIKALSLLDSARQDPRRFQGAFGPVNFGATNIYHDFGLVGLASVGYGFGNGFRVELEGDYRQNPIRTITTPGVPTIAGGNTKTYGPMINALYDFDLTQYGLPPYVVPYLGLGIGYQWTTFDNVTIGTTPGHVPSLTNSINSTTSKFAYQAILGAAFPVTGTGLAITTEFRFLGVAPDETFKGSGSFNGAPLATKIKIGSQFNYAGLLGVRYAFQAAPPPPPPAPVQAPAPAPARSYLVFFDWDRADLTDRAKQIIAEAAQNSTRVQYTRIQVNGYTDTSGTPAYNQRLSVRRAQSVAAELVRDGVPRNVISIQGFGETHLLVPTGPGVREPQNRRVEIIIQ